MTRTSESRPNTNTALTEIAWASAQDADREFHSLMHHINVDSLRRCFHMLDGKKAVGADRITKEQYGEQLQENLENLIHRMKRMSYCPGPVRQVLIPKEGKSGATRPLGISNFEDKLVQKQVQEILESIYDPIFLNSSYGFRPKVGCHDAIRALHQHLFREEVEIVIDVDLANYFNTIDHKILENILRVKIKDSKFLQYVSRMFKAGVLAEGELMISEEGVAQGSCCSPVLANIMAHYVIDLWLEGVVKPRMAGSIRAFRYADDLIICCRYEKDAIKIKRALNKRLEKYKLKLNEDKTKLVPFSKIKSKNGVRQGVFDFLGFTFYLSKTQNKHTIPKLKTCGKRLRTKLKRVNEWARKVRCKHPLSVIWKTFCAKLRGHVQYYGVTFNSKKVQTFLRKAQEIMFKWLNRRSQRKSFCWDKFILFTNKYPLPEAKVCHALF